MMDKLIVDLNNIYTSSEKVFLKMGCTKYIIIMIFLVFLTSFTVGALFNLIIFEQNAIINSSTSNLETIPLIFLALLLAPVVETLLFQVFFYKVLHKLKPMFKNILTSCFFAANHPSSEKQIVASFFICCLLNLSYAHSKNRGWNSFFVVATIHAGYNLLITGLFLLVKNS